MQTEPEQWARDLLEAVHDASDMGSACGMVDCPQCKAAALTIQRAFEERTGQLIPAPDDAMVERVALALVDDPEWIEAGIPDEAIEAGIAAWDEANADMDSETPKRDWDEGMIVAAIFKAVGRAALGDAS